VTVEIERRQAQPSGDYLEGVEPSPEGSRPLIAPGAIVALALSTVAINGLLAFGTGYAARRAFHCR
jgi:hypothetical protein